MKLNLCTLNVIYCQTWDLLRIAVEGFLSFCEWFFKTVSPNGKYFISPLRINGSALESVFSILKFSSGGNLSALSYGPALGKLISRKDQTHNKFSEHGYRDLVINVDGAQESNFRLSIKVLKQNSVCFFQFPENVSQSTIGDRQGSNACTIVALKFGAYYIGNNLDISLHWNQLPRVWEDCFVNSVCEGNYLYDQAFSDSSVMLDVDNVISLLGRECSLQFADQPFYFTDANYYNDLVDFIETSVKDSSADCYGVIIGSGRSVGLLVKVSGHCAIIDSHQHPCFDNSGGLILMSNSVKAIVVAYFDILRRHSVMVLTGTMTWVKYIL